MVEFATGFGTASPDLAPVLAGAAVDDARIGFFEGGAKKNDIRRFDIHHPKIKCSITVEGLDNLLTLFNIQILRVKVPVHTVPLQTLAGIGRYALAGSAARVQFQKLLIAPDAAAIFRRAGAFAAYKLYLPSFALGIFFDGRKPDIVLPAIAKIVLPEHCIPIIAQNFSKREIFMIVISNPSKERRQFLFTLISRSIIGVSFPELIQVLAHPAHQLEDEVPEQS